MNGQHSQDRRTVTVAALFVDRHGCYADMPNVEVWDKERDARLYGGPYPVVAHPPCARWCHLSWLVESRYGYRCGDDGGCFAFALAAVRQWGGVLEHPAYSRAWSKYGIERPPRGGGWVVADDFGGWTCHVNQLNYGHPARKATWLYARLVRLPSMRWGCCGHSEAVISFCRRRTGDNRRRINGRPAEATPLVFRDTLLDIARSVRADHTTP